MLWHFYKSGGTHLLKYSKIICLQNLVSEFGEQSNQSHYFHQRLIACMFIQMSRGPTVC